MIIVYVKVRVSGCMLGQEQEHDLVKTPLLLSLLLHEEFLFCLDKNSQIDWRKENERGGDGSCWEN